MAASLSPGGLHVTLGLPVPKGLPHLPPPPPAFSLLCVAGIVPSRLFTYLHYKAIENSPISTLLKKGVYLNSLFETLSPSGCLFTWPRRPLGRGGESPLGRGGESSGRKQLTLPFRPLLGLSRPHTPHQTSTGPKS